ncbi:MAG: PEP-utilizing enzyme [Candidatus Nanopelagicales bacterium]|nr:PEP-utilizing enzyme [Candidatus Nanopelagicales bacterium]
MLIDLSTQPPALLVGAKASRLGWLMARGWAVPAGAVAPFEATDRIAAEGPEAAPELRAALGDRLVPGAWYIVRSSANVEDSGQRSFAGQFETVSDVTGIDEVMAAIHRVACSGRTAQVHAYARHVGVDPAGVRVAAIVQELVPARASGVAFSRDPITGAGTVVVEGVAGRGEPLVGRGVDPQRWVHDGRDTHVAPADPVLPQAALEELVGAVRAIERSSGQPVDVEWVWDGARLHLVQWRPITALAEVPRIWSSRLARDMLPGLIPPLVWSVNVPVLSHVWADLIAEALGDVGLDPDELVRPFGYRAYFNTTALGRVFTSLGMPPDALEQMRAGTGASVRPPMSMLVRRTPRLARFAGRLASWPRHAEPERADLERARAAAAATDLAALGDAALLAHVAGLRALLARAARLNVVTPLLADARASVVRRAGQARGLDPGALDPGQDLPAVLALDPAHALAGIEATDEGAWQRFLERFGHLSDSPNDCSVPTWAEESETIRRVLTQRAPAPGGAPGRGPRRGPEPAAGARAALLAATPPLGRRRMARRWDRAAAARRLREEVGHTYARTYALFRPAFLEAGRRLVARGQLAEPADVFLLALPEVADALRGGLPDAASLAAARRQEMDESADLHWPETIIGDDPVPVRGRVGATLLTGVPTSRGRHTGPARVVTALARAGPVGREDVLVLAASDVTWTPLLLQAGAVVTETGGMLSHASIVAREFGLPCVASVHAATTIPDGTIVCVDGAAGEVLVLEQLDATAGQDPDTTSPAEEGPPWAAT